MKYVALLAVLVLMSSFLFINENRTLVFASSDIVQQNCYTGDVYIEGANGNQPIAAVKEQYWALVTSFNAEAVSIRYSYPNATLEAIHAGMQDNYYQKMISIKNCLESNGVNPDSIIEMNSQLKQIVGVPEFGSLSGMIIAISIIGVIVISRRFNLRF